jgi:hypothetical protein
MNKCLLCVREGEREPKQKTATGATTVRITLPFPSLPSCSILTAVAPASSPPAPAPVVAAPATPITSLSDTARSKTDEWRIWGAVSFEGRGESGGEDVSDRWAEGREEEGTYLHPLGLEEGVEKGEEVAVGGVEEIDWAVTGCGWSLVNTSDANETER